MRGELNLADTNDKNNSDDNLLNCAVIRRLIAVNHHVFPTEILGHTEDKLWLARRPSSLLKLIYRKIDVRRVNARISVRHLDLCQKARNLETD